MTCGKCATLPHNTRTSKVRTFIIYISLCYYYYVVYFTPKFLAHKIFYIKFVKEEQRKTLKKK